MAIPTMVAEKLSSLTLCNYECGCNAAAICAGYPLTANRPPSSLQINHASMQKKYYTIAILYAIIYVYNYADSAVLLQEPLKSLERDSKNYYSINVRSMLCILSDPILSVLHA